MPLRKAVHQRRCKWECALFVFTDNFLWFCGNEHTAENFAMYLQKETKHFALNKKWSQKWVDITIKHKKDSYVKRKIEKEVAPCEFLQQSILKSMERNWTTCYSESFNLKAIKLLTMISIY